ncbi:universal stress protein [Flavobacteriaceae bacterium F89]|uniref:Universal stress protein n=1 Tax=Cerina litoralis TaxID=2874477 RepID=A0AAE3EXT6_9FLAO|nr:universal stress protein [Cerina litoralis]MCG2462334.1 universal stress protein [Cerina litoralis]
MGKQILLPTDFSENSWYAIRYAIKLYENQDCDFFILNTFVKDTYGHSRYTLLDPEETFNRLYEKQSKQGLGNILSQLSELDTDLKHRFHIISRPSYFLEAVKDIVENEQIDMIVMGAKGITGREKGTYGKNSMAVIRSVKKCPVLVVPKNAALNLPEEIVLATNFDIEYSFSEIKYLAEIARISKAKIQVLSMVAHDSLNPIQKSNKVLLQKYFRDINHSFNLLPDQKKKTAVNELIKNSAGNIISYVYRSPSFWERMGLGTPTMGKLGYFKDIPILALNG